MRNFKLEWKFSEHETSLKNTIFKSVSLCFAGKRSSVMSTLPRLAELLTIFLDYEMIGNQLRIRIARSDMRQLKQIICAITLYCRVFLHESHSQFLPSPKDFFCHHRAKHLFTYVLHHSSIPEKVEKS